MKTLVVTGGAGFIGSNFVRNTVRDHPDYKVVVMDLLTYAGNLDNLSDMLADGRITFVQGDIRDRDAVRGVLKEADMVVNFAAESFVDRSILEPDCFITTDVLGTFTLLEAAREFGVERFVQVSTDEVYGSVEEGSSTELDTIQPNSPYSASKAGGDLLARSYYVTYGVPVVVTRGSNTYGPYQHPEKLIPLFVTNAVDDKSLPIYGDGQQVRDWLHVDDHCSAVDVALHKGVLGEVYNVGGGSERTNMEITRLILDSLGKTDSLIRYVSDRPGHDKRYSLNCEKLQSLGWRTSRQFEEAFRDTVEWYRDNQNWWRKVKDSDSYRQFSRTWYSDRK